MAGPEGLRQKPTRIVTFAGGETAPAGVEGFQ